MINPTTYEGFASRLVSAAEKLTLTLLSSIGNALSTLARDPYDLPRVRTRVEAKTASALADWSRSWRRWVDEDLALAYMAGIRHTDAEIRRLAEQAKIRMREPSGTIYGGTELATGGGGGGALPPAPPPGGPFDQLPPGHLTYYGTFRRAAFYSLEGTDLQIMRASRDILRQIAAEIGDARYREGAITTRQRFSKEMGLRLAKEGIRVVRYANGRTQDLSTYVEMVGRTMSGRTAVQASLNRYQEYGYTLVRVSAHFRACKLCTPWEGKILDQAGQSDEYPPLEDAIRSGLFHPNCAHDINAYIPGVSPEQDLYLDPEEQALVDEYGYAQAQEIAYNAQQKQRAIERKIRDLKRQQAIGGASVNVQIRDAQAQMRDHLEKHTFLRRKRERERLGFY